MIEVSNQEKSSIIMSRMKSISFNKYAAELTLIEENASINKNQDNISTAQLTIDDCSARLSALQEEYDALNLQ